MNRKIKNIIFDFGGVLVDLDKQACVDAFERIGAHAIAGYVDECRQEDLCHELEIGNISVPRFCELARRQSGSTASDDDFCQAWNALLSGIPRRRLEALLRLRDHCRLALLSNTNAIHWKKAVEKLFPMDGLGVNDYFEETYLSYELHLLKPGQEIFEYVLRDLQVRADETLFVDDSAANCAGARLLGIHALKAEGDEWIEKLNEMK